MRFSDLVGILDGVVLCGTEDPEVSAVTEDSRRTDPDTVFVAVKGARADGHAYLPAALERGCRAAVVAADALAGLPQNARAGFAALAVAPDTRQAPALLARNLRGRPDEKLLTAAVTGTNGKTTVSFLLQSVLGSLRGPCGLLGTIRYEAGGYGEKAPLTTPSGPVLYAWLDRMVQAGCLSVAMELSSHALDQGRAAGLGLDVAVMTNLGRDHLDYHRDLDSYLRAKAQILDLLRPGGTAVINADDPALAPLADGPDQVVLFSARPETSVRADLKVLSCRLAMDATQVELDWRGKRLRVHSPLVGRYNVENLAATLAAVLGAGFPAEEAAPALQQLRQVPGRMERIALPTGAVAVVDYAHTADALAAVLRACTELEPRRLLVVFGCGGDRDRGKRPLMGRVAAELADGLWITADNPRSEDPAAINREILAGVRAVTAPRATTREVVPDRATAIAAALDAAQEGDIVVIAGKGHEDYQLVGDKVLDLDDRALVRAWAGARKDGHD